MDIVKVNELVAKLRNGNLSSTEEQQLMIWLHHFNMDGNSGFGDDELFTAQQKMWQQIDVSKAPVKNTKSLKLYTWITSAAAVVLITLGVILYHNGNANRFYMANDIAAGKNTAILTLADGRKIDLGSLKSGEMLRQDGLVAYKTADGQLVYEIKPSSSKQNSGNGLNILSTSNGQTYQVMLPDGSRVWLNAASSLQYATDFGNDHPREVELKGEAYFEVKKDSNHPFRVKTKAQIVEVLGTHFNINSYSEENTVRTTLMEGSVKVKSAVSGLEKILQPNQQAVLSASGIQIMQVKTNEIIDWKDGKFVFSNEDIESLMRKIARWYNVEVVYEGEITKERFGGQVSRSQPISKILEALQLTGFVQFKAEGRRITVLSND
ncbi:fec operon regulator FecR [compost metagenome]